MTGPVVEAQHLRKVFQTRSGPVTAVEDVSFTLARKGSLAIVGESGSGKTTVARMLVGLIAPTAGSALIFGVAASRPAARASVGYLPADAAFVPRLTGIENLEVLASLRGSDGAIDRHRVASALTFTPEEMSRPVSQLSSGMRQKLGLVAAMQHRPELVILDEPANRLDPLVHRAFCQLLRELAAEGRTVLLSSHVLGEVEEVCDRIALIKAGRLVRLADVDSVRAESLRRVTLRYAAPPRPPAELLEAQVSGNVVTGRIPAGRPDLVRKLAAGRGVVDIEVEPPSLEDVFLDLYGEGA